MPMLDEKGTTTAPERAETVSTHSTHDTDRHDRSGVNRFLLVATIVLAVVTAGLVTWIVVDDDGSGSDVAPTDAVMQVRDDYADAWNAYDGDRFLELVTDGYTFTVNRGAGYDAERQAVVIRGLDRSDWHVTTVGEPIMAGDGPWYVAQVDRIESTSYDEPVFGVSLVTVVDIDGELRIRDHRFYGALG